MKGHKGHKGRHHKATGGVNEASEDMNLKNQKYTYESNVNDEATKRKHGGRTKKHHSMMVDGEHAKHHAGRKPRKSGGRATSDANPFTSARHGTPPKDHKVETEFE
jgi:hypothetical protein